MIRLGLRMVLGKCGGVIPPPAAPVASAATSVMDTSFVANWGAVTGATGYRLDVSTSNVFATFVSGYENLAVEGTSQAVTGLTQNTTYYYRVRAVNAGGTSANSEPISVKTWAPSDILGLVGWFDASQLALSNNDPVATWNNLVAGGNNITQATAIRQPKFITNQQNGKPVVRFGVAGDDVDTADFMTSGVFGITGAYSIVIAGVFEAKLSGATRAGIVYCASTGAQVMSYEESNRYLSAYVSSTVITPPAKVISSPCIVMALSDGTNYRLAVNATFNDSIARNGSIATSLNWGCQAATRHLLGSMFEICVFNKVISIGADSEHSRLLAYFANKWGIQQ